MIESFVPHEGYLFIADRVVVDIFPEVSVDLVLD